MQFTYIQKARSEHIGDWEISFYLMFQDILERHISEGDVVYDAGCGKGRLFKWVIQKAKAIYGKELDENRFKEAEKEAKKIDAASINVLNGSITEIDDLARIGAQPGTFDVVICSHVFQHVPFSVCQQAIQTFHTLLRPHGKLILLVSKDNATEMSHWKSVGKEFAPEQAIDISEYQQICREGIANCLPIRKFTFPLMEDILRNPYSQMLNEIFKDEGDFNHPAEKTYFNVVDWRVCQSKTAGDNYDVYVDYDNLQRDYPQAFKQLLGSDSVEYTAENRAKIESFINLYSYLKHQYLLDMTIIAEKVS